MRKKRQIRVWLQASPLVVNSIGWTKLNDIWDEIREECMIQGKWPCLKKVEGSRAMVPDSDDPDIVVVQFGEEAGLGILYTNMNGDKVVYFKYLKERFEDNYMASDGAHKVGIPPS